MKLTTTLKEERTQQTFSGWKRAIKQKFPNATFEGDKDIAQAFISVDGKKKGVGEWDGATGTTYSE